MAAVRVGLIGDDFILNPSYREIERGDLDIVVAGSPEGIVMIEAGANQLSEQDTIEAIDFGYEAVTELIKSQEDLLKDLGEVLGDIGFNIFTKAIKSGGSIKSITVKGGNSSISNVRIKPGGDIFQVAQDAGAGGLAFIRVKGDELETIGAIKNNLYVKHTADILRITEAQDGDLILLGAGDKQIVNQSLDRVRQYIAKDLNLIDKSKWNFLWVTDFPMFERNEEENRYEALHHPFCSPKNIKSKDPENLQKEIEDFKANAYDLVLNGLELGGGSLRIHEANLQREVLKKVGLTDKEIDEKFGFLIEA